MKHSFKMFTCEDFLSQKGNPLKRIDDYIYRFKSRIRSGVVWRCVRKNCKAKVLIHDNFIKSEDTIHKHPKEKRKINENTKRFNSSSLDNHNMETDIVKVNEVQEEEEFDSTKQLANDKQFYCKKSFYDKATNKEEKTFCEKATKTELSFWNELENTKKGLYNTEELNFRNSYENVINIDNSEKSLSHLHSVSIPIDYENWDDPNELVDRLRLLVAERDAGCDKHAEEIQLIIEELKKADIIY